MAAALGNIPFQSSETRQHQPNSAEVCNNERCRCELVARAMLDARSCRPGEVIHLARNTRAAVVVVVVCDSNIGEKQIELTRAALSIIFSLRPSKIIDEVQITKAKWASDSDSDSRQAHAIPPD